VARRALLFLFLSFAPRTSSLDRRNSDFDLRAERASVREREREREINGRARVSPTRVASNFICIAKKNKKIFQQQKKTVVRLSSKSNLTRMSHSRVYFVRYERKTEEEEEEEEEEDEARLRRLEECVCVCV